MVPTRADAESWIRNLLTGLASRSEASDWALEYTLYDDPQLYPEVTDARTSQALSRLAGADLRPDSERFLHGANDFVRWLEDLIRDSAADDFPAFLDPNSVSPAVVDSIYRLTRLLISGPSPEHAVLLGQLESSRLLYVEFSGAGLFAHFSVPDTCPRLTATRLRVRKEITD